LRQVEQDLIISRALCDLFNSPARWGKIAFRGGTAINKLLFRQPLRYSEDIDLVQTQSEADRRHGRCDPRRVGVVGQMPSDQPGHSMHLVFRFTPEVDADSDVSN
jgi:hypothetical protein